MSTRLGIVSNISVINETNLPTRLIPVSDCITGQCHNTSMNCNNCHIGKLYLPFSWQTPICSTAGCLWFEIRPTK